MARYEIIAQYEYSGVVEADSQEEAYTAFLRELNDYYSDTLELDIEKLEEEEA